MKTANNAINPTKQRQYLINLLNRVPKSEIQLQSKCAELLYFFYTDHWKRLVCVYNNSLKANVTGFGQVPGASDMFFLKPNGCVIFIEFKFGRNNMQPNQVEWEALCKLYGHIYHTCYTEVDFWELIDFTQPCEADIDNLIWLK